MTTAPPTGRPAASRIRVSHDRSERSLAAGTRISFGRRQTSDVVLSDPRASKDHGTLTFEGGRWRFTDTSSNGTFVEGRRVSTIAIEGAVELRFGASDGEVAIVSPESNRRGFDGAPSVAFRGTRTLTVGRDPSNDIVVPDPRVSRRHAEIVPRPDGTAQVQDLQSANGTYVNGSRITTSTLREGDLVGIGSHTLVFVRGGLEPLTATSEDGVAASHVTVTAPNGAVLLDDVSLSIPPDRLVAVIGPSGAGKSTLVDVLSGARAPSHGHATYRGLDVGSSLGLHRSRMGVVPQSDIIHTQLTAKQALGYASELRFSPDTTDAERRARVQQVIDELGLTDRADQPIRFLSGGQRKRASVGIELLTKPSLLFLDEPTSGLDPGNETEMMAVLRRLAADGRIVVVVTHSIASLDLADLVIFIAPGGQLAYFGPPDGLGAYMERVAGAADLAAAFRAMVGDEQPVAWKLEFERDPAYATYVRGPLDASVPARVSASGDANLPKGAFRQWAILVRRYLAVIRADRITSTLLASQAPLIGLLIVLTFPQNVMDSNKSEYAILLLWLLMIGATWLGASNAAREVVKERAIVRRERAVGQSVGAYLMSKVAVLGAITTLQCVALLLIALIPQRLPASNGFATYLSNVELFALPGMQVPFTDIANRAPVPATSPLFFPTFRLEIAVAVVLTGLAAMALGLLLSSIVRTSDQSLVVLPLVLVGQVLVSLPLFVTDSIALRVLSTFSCARWGLEAAGSTVNLWAMYYAEQTKIWVAETLGGADIGFTPEPKWQHTAGSWGVAIGILVLMAVVALLGAFLSLTRERDVWGTEGG